jgi:hypothetical protein
VGHRYGPREVDVDAGFLGQGEVVGIETRGEVTRGWSMQRVVVREGGSIAPYSTGNSATQEFSGRELDEGWRTRLQDVSRLFSAVRNIIIYKQIHEQIFFFCQGAFCNMAQYSQCHLQRRGRCMSLAQCTLERRRTKWIEYAKRCGM